jgi:PQQ-like domain
MRPKLRRFRNVTLALAVAAAALSGGHSLRLLEARGASPKAAPASPHSPDPTRLEKTVVAEDVPLQRGELSVSADGKHSYFPSGGAYYVFDEHGDFVNRMAIRGDNARTLVPLANGRFISAQSHGTGQLALLAPDGAELRSLVKRGAPPGNLRADQTGWTSPTGAAFDAVHQLLFALDTTLAPAGVADPDWSRIAVFDGNGKYLREIAAYAASNGEPADEHRTWYDDIEVDPKRSLVYVTARASKQLWAFDYTGALRARAPGVAGIAVLPNGNVAVEHPDGQHVQIFDPTLHPLQTLAAAGVVDLEADAAGRLYASVADPAILYLRWPADLSVPEAIHPRFRQISVGIPFDSVVAGRPFSVPVSIDGRPTPTDSEWHAFVRPSDGSNLDWRELDATYHHGTLDVRPTRELLGFNQIAVRYGKGAIDRAAGARDLHVEKTVRFDPEPDGRALILRSSSERAGFRRGEAITFRVEAPKAATSEPIALALSRDGRALLTTTISSGSQYWELPAALTRRLMPGHYTLSAQRGPGPVAVYDLDLADAEPSSPMQRILYHEFGQSLPGAFPVDQLGTAEQLAFTRDYLDNVASLGFSRETDRSGLQFIGSQRAGVWRVDTGAEPTTRTAIPEAGSWVPELYLDRATARGVCYDTQIFAHCAGVRLADGWFPPLDGALQRLSQWFGKYPAFYGFNYNDELFFSADPADTAWLAAAAIHRSKPDAYRVGLSHMYDQLDRAVREVRPDLGRTATPMWQFPAVEGSYAPTIYANMTESYSHYLSEGYSWPFCPAHSAEFLRRPGMPLMAIFDNGYRMGDGESYLKNALQVLGRGVQGFGVEHELPLLDAPAANALRVMNQLGAAYGPIFAEAEPRNEGAVLYSYAEDVTEKRDFLGTPHWERVLALYGAGLMAGLPLSITYEEDVARGLLVDHGRAKVKLLFLVGQTAELPENVKSALRVFRAAGGTVVIDADSRELPQTTRFPVSLMAPAQAAHGAPDVDALFPDVQPAYTAIAGELNQQFGRGRGFPVDTNDPWVAKSHFDGGAIQYVLIASETSPYPWSPASVWALGGRYSKSYWPKQVELTVPRSPVIYDVFERRVVPSVEAGKTAVIPANLTTFPGKLYALAPSVLAAPTLRVSVEHDTITYSVNVGLAARVPLRIVLGDPRGSVSTVFRGTNLRGELVRSVARPAGPGPWRLEVSELLGGATSSVELPPGDVTEPWVSPLPEVDAEREPLILELLRKPERNLRLLGDLDTLPRELGAALLTALKRKGLQPKLAQLASAPPSAPSGSSANSATYLVLTTMAGKGPSELIRAANSAGLFTRKLDDRYPGTGRGLLSAAFAPRVYGENCIAIVGGDQRGLELATRRFIALLNGESPPTRAPSTAGAASPRALVGVPDANVNLPKLSDRIGVRLSAILAWHGKLALAANGYASNLARVDDEGDHGRIVSAKRVGESPLATSLFLSSDGSSFGLAARTISRFGEAFFLSSSAAAAAEAFTSFGDAAPLQHVFSASGDASTVLAPGPYGVVAWKRTAGRWREAWALDYWKKFDSLDWSINEAEERIPSFDTLVPRNGDLGLIAFGEFSNVPWLSNQKGSHAEVSARSLTDGTLRWSFSPPVTGGLVFPRIYADDDGALVVLQTQLGASGPLRYFALDKGRLVGTWNSDKAPLGFELSTRSKRVASAYGGGSRLLEIRQMDGSVVLSKIWHAQPLAIAFAADGESVFVSDDEGLLSRVDAHGEIMWQTQLGCSAELARDGERLYAAGWDGRVRAFTADGREHWKLDLTSAMTSTVIGASGAPAPTVHEPQRQSSATSTEPRGTNLLRSGQATLNVGGTPGWKSAGLVGVQASALTNGAFNDVVAPWIPADEVFMDGTAFRKVWAELNFEQPTSIHTLTVRENPDFPESWPTESLIQVWDQEAEHWSTVKHGVFLRGPLATYALDLQRVKRLRYVPWSNSFRNFHTSEIEVR